MPARHTLLIYALPLLAVWIAVSTRHPGGKRPPLSRENLAAATTTCGFQLLDEAGEPLDGAVVETHAPLANREGTRIEQNAGTVSGLKRHREHVMIVDTVDLGPAPRSVAGCRFHIGWGDRPIHREVTLLESDNGRDFTPAGRYRANGTRAVFGTHRYWRLQYPALGSDRRVRPATINLPMAKRRADTLNVESL